MSNSITCYIRATRLQPHTHNLRDSVGVHWRTHTYKMRAGACTHMWVRTNIEGFMGCSIANVHERTVGGCRVSSGMNVTRPAFARCSSSVHLRATSALSTTTWNNELPACELYIRKGDPQHTYTARLHVRVFYSHCMCIPGAVHHHMEQQVACEEV